jgi:glycine cleavage system H lipoate-binding protein
MQAGVVKRKICPHGYQCTTCRYDRILHRQAENNHKLKSKGITSSSKRASIISWKEKLMEQPVSLRPCLHHMKARIDLRVCNNAYHCADCEFDQYFDEQFSVHAAIKPISLMDIEGFKFPHGIYLHPGHTWLKIEEDNTVRVGLDEFILRTLGPLNRISMPLLGKKVIQDRPDITLVRGSNAVKVLSPISGVVTAANPKMAVLPELGQADAYANGWILRIHTDDLRKELKNLKMGKETTDYIGKEVERLYTEIEEVAGPLAADGGHLGEDICGKLPQLNWIKLARKFLRT